MRRCESCCVNCSGYKLSWLFDVTVKSLTLTNTLTREFKSHTKQCMYAQDVRQTTKAPQVHAPKLKLTFDHHLSAVVSTVRAELTVTAEAVILLLCTSGLCFCLFSFVLCWREGFLFFFSSAIFVCRLCG